MSEVPLYWGGGLSGLRVDFRVEGGGLRVEGAGLRVEGC
jgi:hypothetical protein